MLKRFLYLQYNNLKKINKMENLTALETKLAAALTERGHKNFTNGQLNFICNSTHDFTIGKTWNQFFYAERCLDLMVGQYIDLSNLTKY